MTTLTERVAHTLLDLGALSPAGYAIALDIELSTPRFLFQTYPEAWLREYSAKGYVMQDATVAWGMQATGHIRWSELIANDHAGIFDAASQYGLRFGVAVAFMQREHRTIASFARPEREFTDAEIRHLTNRLADLYDLLSGDEQPDLEEIRKIRAISVALSHN